MLYSNINDCGCIYKDFPKKDHWSFKEALMLVVEQCIILFFSYCISKSVSKVRTNLPLLSSKFRLFISITKISQNKPASYAFWDCILHNAYCIYIYKAQGSVCPTTQQMFNLIAHVTIYNLFHISAGKEIN